MKHRMLHKLLGALIAISVVGLVSCQAGAPGQPEEELPSALVVRDDLIVVISASGRVEPVARADLLFEGAGRVAEVPVDVGDSVQPGDLLAQLEAEQLTLQVAQAQAALDSAEARLAQLQAGPRAAEVAAQEANVRGVGAQVDASNANLARLLSGASAAQIASAEADLASALSQRRTAEDFHDKTMTCKTFELPTGEKQTICPALGPIEEQARINLEAADKALAAAQARLDELLAGADANAALAALANVAVVEAQQDAAQARVDLLVAGATEAELAAAEAQVTQAQIALEQAQLELAKAALRAPLSGIVAEVNVTPGEAPPMGRPAISILDTSSFRVPIEVDELDVGRLAEGQSAQVRLDALPGEEVAGTVRRIAPAAMVSSGVVSYDVIVDLAPTDVPMRVDMTANVTVVVEELTDVLVIPTWVVRVDRLTNQTYVDKQVADGFERVDVELGVRREGLAEVISGLSEGDVVVRAPDSGAFSFELGQ